MVTDPYTFRPVRVPRLRRAIPLTPSTNCANVHPFDLVAPLLPALPFNRTGVEGVPSPSRRDALTS